MSSALHWSHVWLWRGVRAGAAMAWMTLWPLVFGLALSGVVRATVGGERFRRALGRTSPASVATATGLGVVSSSCSYAASATLNADELRAHVPSHIAAFNVPTLVAFSKDPLPRNPAGKFLKRELRQTFFP